MKIEIAKIKQVDFNEASLWIKENNYQNSALLTGDPLQSEFSICGWNPVEEALFSNDKQVWAKLDKLINKYDFAHLVYPANRCGWIGYLNYDLGRYIESIPDKNIYSYQIPQARLVIYKNYRYWDNKNNKCWEIEFAFTEYETSKKTNYLENYQLANFTQECNESEYCQKVETIQDLILQGEVYEVNLTQQFSADFIGSSLAFFLNLYEKNNGPFSAYLSYSDFTVASISPEQFLYCDQGKVSTKPIKGTAPRGKNDQEDQANRDFLLSSKKDLAELHMIVDLLRNDLSKVCQIGSVKVLNPNKLEVFANVFHLVGIVEGRLKPNISIVNLIKACFPGGSITGCPKIASMKVIEDLESYKRNLYTGSILLVNKTFLTSSIVIRTGIIVDDKLYVNSGGAITIDSQPANEYQEILHKIRNFLDIKEGK